METEFNVFEFHGSDEIGKMIFHSSGEIMKESGFFLQVSCAFIGRCRCFSLVANARRGNEACKLHAALKGI